MSRNIRFLPRHAANARKSLRLRKRVIEKRLPRTYSVPLVRDSRRAAYSGTEGPKALTPGLDKRAVVVGFQFPQKLSRCPTSPPPPTRETSRKRHLGPLVEIRVPRLAITSRSLVPKAHILSTKCEPTRTRHPQRRQALTYAPHF